MDPGTGWYLKLTEQKREMKPHDKEDKGED